MDGFPRKTVQSLITDGPCHFTSTAEANDLSCNARWAVALLAIVLTDDGHS